MSISISNRSPTYTAPVESKPETYAAPSTPAATETPDLSPLLDLMKDAFSADPSASSGYGDLTGEGSGGTKDIAQMAQELIKHRWALHLHLLHIFFLNHNLLSSSLFVLLCFEDRLLTTGVFCH